MLKKTSVPAPVLRPRLDPAREDYAVWAGPALPSTMPVWRNR